MFLNLEGKKCLVVGGGKVAERKVAALARCGAEVHVVSPRLTGGLRHMAEQGRIHYRNGLYRAGDLDGAFLVICATNDEKTNDAVARDCAGGNIMVNVVDDPPRCSFFVPSVVHRGPLKLAISTGGNSPHLARLIREKLEGEFGPPFTEFVEYLGEIRQQVMHRVADTSRRRLVLNNLVDDTTFDLVRQGDIEQAKERVRIVYHRHGCQP